MPEGETLENFASHGARRWRSTCRYMCWTMWVARLSPHYGEDCPVAIVWRASWPDQKVVRATLGTVIDATTAKRGRTALILVGRALTAEEFRESCLYAGDYDRRSAPWAQSHAFPRAQNDRDNATAKGLMISAPASGTGKTTLMLGLLNALSRRGVDVRPFKSGPDYIDPASTVRACGRSSYNIDSWAMGSGVLCNLIGTAHGGDLALIEGSMGLFDGVAATGGDL